jgi:hypothetical protein
MTILQGKCGKGKRRRQTAEGRRQTRKRQKAMRTAKGRLVRRSLGEGGRPSYAKACASAKASATRGWRAKQKAIVKGQTRKRQKAMGTTKGRLVRRSLGEGGRPSYAKACASAKASATRGRRAKQKAVGKGQREKGKRQMAEGSRQWAVVD